MKVHTIKIKGVSYDCVTLAGLGELCGGRHPRTMRRLIERDIMPPANLRLPSKTVNGEEVNGASLFLMETAKEIAEVIIAELIPRKKIKDETINKLFKILKEERKKLSE